MRLSVLGLSFALLLTGRVPCLGQQPSGPQTLENLVRSDEGEDGPATDDDAADAEGTPVRPAGTLARPKDGVQHPNLDKAWTEYDAAVAKAAEGIRAAITKQFDRAAEDGKLELAEKWQAIGAAFEKEGALPKEKESEKEVKNASEAFARASESLKKAYEQVKKALTMDKKLAEARAASDEWTGLAAGTAVPLKPNKWVQPKNDDAWQKTQGKILTVDSRKGSRNPMATGIYLQKGQMCWVAAHPDDKWNRGRGWPFSDFRGGLPLCIALGGVVAKVADGPVRASRPCELRLFCDDVEAADNAGSIRVKVILADQPPDGVPKKQGAAEAPFKPEKLLAMCLAPVDADAKMTQIDELPVELRGMWWAYAKPDAAGRVELVPEDVRRFASFLITARSWQVANPAVETQPTKFRMMARLADVEGLPSYFLILSDELHWVVHGPVEGRWVLIRGFRELGQELDRKVFELMK